MFRDKRRAEASSLGLGGWILFGIRRRIQRLDAAPVTQVEVPLIDQADAARDAYDFIKAADLYGRAAEQDPTNAAIHIQCGHMSKEAGRAALAEKHYLIARDLTPDDADLHLHLGHFFKVNGRNVEAMASYRKAEDLLPGWQAPIAEIVALRASTPSSVLMVDAFYPRPDSDSGSLDQIMYIKMFQSLGYKVFFAADRELQVQSKYRDALGDMQVSCVVSPEYETIKAFLIAHTAEISLCFLSRFNFGANHLDTVRRTCPHARIVFNAVDLHHVRERREAELKNDDAARAKAEATRTVELAAVTYSDATIVVSEHEAQTLRDAVPEAKVFMIPLVRDYVTGRRASFTERTGIGFIGGYYHLPNVDAVHYFLDQVWPHVRAALPEPTFFVIGSNLPNELAARNDPGVTWVGHVPDLEPWLTRLRITVAPLRYGAGAKGKVVSSLAYGVPCIVSPIAAEGMGLSDSVQVEVGHSPEELAERIVSVYTDPDRWLALSDAGMALVQQRYSLDHGVFLLRGVMKALAMPVPM
jgi:glycosyltransferase involved in cell wall biosynthesis